MNKIHIKIPTVKKSTRPCTSAVSSGLPQKHAYLPPSLLIHWHSLLIHLLTYPPSHLPPGLHLYSLLIHLAHLPTLLRPLTCPPPGLLIHSHSLLIHLLTYPLSPTLTLTPWLTDTHTCSPPPPPPQLTDAFTQLTDTYQPSYLHPWLADIFTQLTDTLAHLPIANILAYLATFSCPLSCPEIIDTFTQLADTLAHLPSLPQPLTCLLAY